MPSKKNVELLEKLKQKIQKAKSIIVVDYSKVDAKTQTKIRQKIKELNGEFFVTKNNIIRLALNKKELDDALVGMNAFVFAYDDPIAPLKAIFDFKKELKLLEVKKGILEDKVLSYEEVEQLSKLPSKDQLIVMLIGGIKAPLTGLLNTLLAPTRDLVYVLNAYKEKKEQQA